MSITSILEISKLIFKIKMLIFLHYFRIKKFRNLIINKRLIKINFDLFNNSFQNIISQAKIAHNLQPLFLLRS